MKAKIQKSASRMCGLVSAIVVATVLIGTAQAANTWTGTGDWNSSANWSDGVPAATQDVIIDGAVTLTNMTPELASFTLNAGKTMTFDGWDTVLNATSVTINGTMTHAINTATTTNEFGIWVPNARVKIACTDLSVPVGGTINLLGKGFQGGVYTNGYGPGWGKATQHRGGGGGYGGPGTSAIGSSASGYKAYGGISYGSASLPDMPGSGGGSTFSELTSSGGAGGGLVQIMASGDVEINGTINANGADGANHCPGAGSGGGVYLQSATLSGAGTVTADGGKFWMGGGGGRIGIDITDTDAQALLEPTLRFSAMSVKGSGETRYHPGSLYFTSRTFFPYETLSYGSYVLSIDNITSLSLSSLTVTAGEPWLPAGVPVDITNDLIVRNSGTLLVVTNSNLTCGGDFTLENSGKLNMYAAATNGVAPGYGNIVLVVGTLNIASDSLLSVYSHPTNGGSMFFDVGSFNLMAGGTVDANGTGFSGGIGPVNGFGPGAGIGGPGDRGGAGGYGGRGATHSTSVGAVGGSVYGQANAPTLPGSGGGGKSGDQGGAGGGLVWMRVRNAAVVNGTITANGGKSFSWTCGDGSGGGIFLDCGSFSGIGLISADGGQLTAANSANGGGGRIAVWEGVSDTYRTRYYEGYFGGAIVAEDLPTTFTGTVSANCGTLGYAGQLAEPGTIVFLTSPPVGTFILIR